MTDTVKLYDYQYNEKTYEKQTRSLHDIGFVFENGGFVGVHIEIVGSREDSHDGRETSRLCLSVHPVSGMKLNRELVSRLESATAAHPASCASWALMIDKRPFRSKN